MGLRCASKRQSRGLLTPSWPDTYRELPSRPMRRLVCLPPTDPLVQKLHGDEKLPGADIVILRNVQLQQLGRRRSTLTILQKVRDVLGTLLVWDVFCGEPCPREYVGFGDRSFCEFALPDRFRISIPESIVTACCQHRSHCQCQSPSSSRWSWATKYNHLFTPHRRAVQLPMEGALIEVPRWCVSMKLEMRCRK